EVGRRAFRFVVGDEVDLPLAPQLDVLAAMAGDQREPHALECLFEHALLGRAELEEFEAVKAERIFEQVRHSFQRNLLSAGGQGSASSHPDRSTGSAVCEEIA